MADNTCTIKITPDAEMRELVASIKDTPWECEEKTKRTRVRCRAFLIALFIGGLVMTAGTYINARYVGYSVSIDTQVVPDNPPTDPQKNYGQKYEDGGKSI